MDDGVGGLVERFLGEDVQLALGDIRTTLSALEADGRYGFELRVLSGQIDRLERRARSLHYLLRSSEMPEPLPLPHMVYAS